MEYEAGKDASDGFVFTGQIKMDAVFDLTYLAPGRLIVQFGQWDPARWRRRFGYSVGDPGQEDKGDNMGIFHRSQMLDFCSIWVVRLIALGKSITLFSITEWCRRCVTTLVAEWIEVDPIRLPEVAVL